MMIDMDKDSYKELNKLSYKRESWRMIANVSNDWRHEEKKPWIGFKKKKTNEHV